jgi:flagellar secretion chaperone FliS
MLNNAMTDHSGYLKIQVETARKERLTAMLMEGAIKFLLIARNTGGNGDLWKYRTNILKAESMILELVGSLNFEKGGDIAVNLHKLYVYMIDLLSQAIDQRRDDKIGEVLNILVPLKETWNEAARKFAEETALPQQRLATGGVRA